MTDPLIERTKVFVSYSHQDKDWLQRLRVHLRPLERRYGVDVWVDTDIKPGSKWREEIQNALASAKVAVLLVSADFIASDFVEKNELPPLLRAAAAEGTVILPLILSPSMFSRMEDLAQFQAVNDPSMPLVNLTKGEQEGALVRLTEAIGNALGYLPNQKKGEHDIARQSEPPRQQTEATGDENRSSERPLTLTRRRTSLAVWLALIAGLVIAVFIAVTVYWQLVYKPSHAEGGNYTGRVTDSRTNRPVRNAKVTIEEGQRVPQIQYSDSEGIFRVMLHGSNSLVRIRVDADNYDTFDRNVTFSRTGVEPISLTSLATTTPTPTPSPKPPTRRPTPGIKQPPLVKCTAQDILLGKC
jgi:hypothetical protein